MNQNTLKNSLILAKMVCIVAVSKAKQTKSSKPEQEVMDALKQAIDSQHSIMTDLVIKGQVDTPAYKEALERSARWTAAWKNNR